MNGEQGVSTASRSEAQVVDGSPVIHATLSNIHDQDRVDRVPMQATNDAYIPIFQATYSGVKSIKRPNNRDSIEYHGASDHPYRRNQRC